MYKIENNQLKVMVRAKGAELNSIYNKLTQLEYMWDADPAFWAKSSPVLFPIVGTLKNDTYYFNEKAYQLPRHGFARDMDFLVTHQTETAISFTLENTALTLEKYPFLFKFTITYSIHENELKVTYVVANTGNGDMYFSVGAHPAFKMPLVNNVDFNDYYLTFNKSENAGRWPISKDGLIEATPLPLLNNSNTLPLTKALFEKDALVFKHLQSNSVTLQSNKNKHGLVFSFTGYPYLGLWAAKNANFICIEPWCGIADSVYTDQQLITKEGIIRLPQKENFEKKWTVNLF